MEIKSIPCPSCGIPAASNDRFCGQCGARLLRAGEIRWRLTLSGELAEVIADESTGASILVKAFELPDESVENPLDAGDEDLVVDVGVESGTLSSLDTFTGEKIWSVGLGKEAFSVSPVSADRLAVFMHGRGIVMALDRSSGRPRWRHRLESPGEWIHGAVSAGAALAGDGSKLLALDADSGDLRWEAALDSPIETVVSGGAAILATTGKGELCSIDPRQGALLWRRDLRVSRLWLADERSAIATRDETVLALDIASGTERWILDSEVQIARVTVGGVQVYLHGADDRLHAVDTKDGTEIWALDEVPFEGESCWAEGERLVVFSGDRLLSVDPIDGSRLWDAPAGEYEIPSVAIDASLGAVYIGTDEGRVASLDLATGSARWEVELPSRTVENLYIDADGRKEQKTETVNADVNQVVADGKGSVFVLADGILFAIGEGRTS